MYHIVVSHRTYDDGSVETYCFYTETERQIEAVKQEAREEGHTIVDIDDLDEECALGLHGDNVTAIFKVDEFDSLEYSDIYEDEDEIITLNGVKYKRI